MSQDLHRGFSPTCSAISCFSATDTIQTPAFTLSIIHTGPQPHHIPLTHRAAFPRTPHNTITAPTDLLRAATRGLPVLPHGAPWLREVGTALQTPTRARWGLCYLTHTTRSSQHPGCATPVYCQCWPNLCLHREKELAISLPPCSCVVNAQFVAVCL